ncbi:hypothetical protein CN958_32040 [Bacillus cereus]|uniref:Uncharacterized protein n=1 Tax=Bacillus cereus TaxID=1396 RepID=A0A2B9DIL1_BACCE|nr:hypothetical protein CN958_32040 [Bacillus cereus]
MYGRLLEFIWFYHDSYAIFCWIFSYYYTFIILAKRTPSSRNVKGHSLVSRWEMNWLRTRDGKSHLNCSTGSKVLLDKLSLSFYYHRMYVRFIIDIYRNGGKTYDYQ